MISIGNRAPAFPRNSWANLGRLVRSCAQSCGGSCAVFRWLRAQKCVAHSAPTDAVSRSLPQSSTPGSCAEALCPQDFVFFRNVLCPQDAPQDSYLRKVLWGSCALPIECERGLVEVLCGFFFDRLVFI